MQTGGRAGRVRSHVAAGSLVLRRMDRQGPCAPAPAPRSGGAYYCYLSGQQTYSYAKMPVMTPNANTPNVMLVTPMKVYFMSKVAARATMTLVMACSIDTRSKAWPWPT